MSKEVVMTLLVTLVSDVCGGTELNPEKVVISGSCFETWMRITTYSAVNYSQIGTFLLLIYELQISQVLQRFSLHLLLVLIFKFIMRHSTLWALKSAFVTSDRKYSFTAWRFSSQFNRI